jgi:hypothetical protein
MIRKQRKSYQLETPLRVALAAYLGWSGNDGRLVRSTQNDPKLPLVRADFLTADREGADSLIDESGVRSQKDLVPSLQQKLERVVRLALEYIGCKAGKGCNLAAFSTAWNILMSSSHGRDASVLSYLRPRRA